MEIEYEEIIDDEEKNMNAASLEDVKNSIEATGQFMRWFMELSNQQYNGKTVELTKRINLLQGC